MTTIERNTSSSNSTEARSNTSIQRKTYDVYENNQPYYAHTKKEERDKEKKKGEEIEKKTEKEKKL
jgi:uncharacterized protein with ATP-grasp and redox domains